ncbi:MAG: signal peptidase II [Defluviitaleaceae bacterium]|nr:signal peptidase II [Defluviitaleaceae bacterium]
MSKKWTWVVFVVATVVLLALDIWLKVWAVDNLQGQPRRVLIDGILGLTYLENTGAIFGLFGGLNARWILAGFKAVILVGVGLYYWWLPHEPRMWFLRVPLILVFAGGVGNLFDRVAIGAVRDMLEFLFINFYIFNLADVYVTVGVFVLAFIALFVIKDFPAPWEKR